MRLNPFRRRQPLQDVETIHPVIVTYAKMLFAREGMLLERLGDGSYVVYGGLGSPYSGIPDDDVYLFCYYVLRVLSYEEEKRRG